METTLEHAIREIENFLSGQGGAYDWDEFTTRPIKNNAELESIRLRCFHLRDAYPPRPGQSSYCNDEGIAVLRRILAGLKMNDVSRRS
jgi:hypothetical protein